MPTTSTYTVTGMTCAHCVQAVKTEIGKIDGATSVDIDLASGRVVVAAGTDIAATDIAAAVDEAGYELAG
jgi:copper chaperone